MVEVSPEAIEWDEHNRQHATTRVSEEEIMQALHNQPTWNRNKRGGRGDLVATGYTDGDHLVTWPCPTVRAIWTALESASPKPSPPNITFFHPATRT
ncbi:MAG: hypothetical protein ACREQ5_00600 [Candidatus Dormibacteria bacterium]